MVMTFMKAYTYPTYAKANQLIWFQSTFAPNAVFGHFIHGKSVKGESTEFGQSFFSAYKSSGGSVSGRIDFDHVTVGEDLIEKETGTFTCKIAGTYLFMFSTETAPDSGATYVHFYVNDITNLLLYGHSDSST